MKIKFHPGLFLLLLCSSMTYAQQKETINPAKTEKSKPLPEGVSADWYQQAVSKLDGMDYRFMQPQKSDDYAGYNKTQHLGFSLHPKGITLSKEAGAQEKAWKTSINIAAVSKGGKAFTANDFISSFSNNEKLTYVYDHFRAEYLNDKTGVRQNFIVSTKPEGEKALTVSLNLGTSLYYEVANNKLVAYNSKSNKSAIAFMYDDLKVWDAAGKSLPASMKLTGNKLDLVVNDENAVYPVTIDPLSHTPEWTTSADGILPALLTNLQLQIDALYGFNVAGLGDVNGDGYDDVAIGAPGAVDVIAGPATVVGAGAVFVYFGSATGLPTTPSKTLRATTAITNALFGFSVAGGNVTGNSRNDIIVGAPGTSYSTLANATIPASVTVTAGKVFVFRGEDMANTNPSPLFSLYLNGTTYFSKGILGVLASNITVNALFGFSVSTTDDMNGDGLGEVIVGAPGYGEIGLLTIRSGAAFVVYSSNLAGNTVTKLTAPTSTLLGIPLLNTEGLLFGYSVDGAGDYDRDGKPDVVVGAPAGISLTLGNLLGGSAYIYKGNGTGVNTTHAVQLKATPSLVGTIANLFGYSVRGVKNANGVRNGSVLIGAPTGNVLSSILNGLRLKAGSVNLFKSKTSPAASETPTQVIPSPRTSSLLSILAGQNLDVTALFGASIDNMYDVNCDGYNDIIVGEPLSSSVGLINADVVGGSAMVFLGKPDSTFNTTASWSVENSVSYNAGVNAGSLLGYSVAGAGHVKGASQGVRAIIGAPGAALDFSSGIFNLGGTLNTLLGFVAGNNGLGKTYAFAFTNCGGIRFNPDVNVTYVNVPVPGNVSTNDVVPTGSTYGTPVPSGSNPTGASIIMFSDGSYTFTSPTPGVYTYWVPLCMPGESAPCKPIELVITVLTVNSTTNPPVANADVAFTMVNMPVTIMSLMNDRCSNIGCSLNPTSVTITANPLHGTATINYATGDITYTPAAGYVGKDTLTYRVCDNGSPSKCASAKQIITVTTSSTDNSTDAADDYITINQGSVGIGNVKVNDTDPQHNNQAVASQTTTLNGKGTLELYTDGTYIFTPANGFSGPVEFVYTTCDDGTPQACASATLYIMVMPVGGPLAVNVTNFSYAQKDCGITLKWSTSQEVNMKEYSIENSLNGTDWINIGSVAPHGSTSASTEYSLTHASPVKGQSYYRLVMTDKQGVRTYSRIIIATASCSSNSVAVNPNPFSDKVNVYFVSDKAEMANFTLLTDEGKTIVSMKTFVRAGSNMVTIPDLGRLPSGVYILQVKTTSKVYNHKMLK